MEEGGTISRNTEKGVESLSTINISIIIWLSSQEIIENRS
jgi:hypothetical protein